MICASPLMNSATNAAANAIGQWLGYAQITLMR